MVRIFRGEDFDGFEYDLYALMTIQSGVIPLKNGPNGKQPETDQNSGDGGTSVSRVGERLAGDIGRRVRRRHS